ncbi:MAG: 3-deoxy-manno-octulosonate cytidylyltransferase [Pseudomonadota bacterium]
MTSALIVIPARYASTRLPGKPLLAETGKPLIQHTVEQAAKVEQADVVVATDDDRIAAAVTAFGGSVAMTDPTHQSGTDRVAEAARHHNAEIIINVQGDEPEISPDVISHLIETHRKAQAGPRPAFASTLVCPFPKETDPKDSNAVKAVLSQPDYHGVRSALYFSRSPVPFPRSDAATPFLHLGLYAFTKDSLQAFPALPRTPLEQTESLEQLRILEHGHRIACGVVEAAAPGIDTPEDYAAFVARQNGKG